MSLLFALKGTQGDKGDKGDKGDEGDKGDKGDTGEQGISAFVDRGDVENTDFETGDFTKDETWRELDLSGLIPAGQPLLFLRLKMHCPNALAYLLLRPKGDVNGKNIVTCRTQVINNAYCTERFIRPDADGKIEYWASATTWTQLSFLISGWFVLE